MKRGFVEVRRGKGWVRLGFVEERRGQGGVRRGRGKAGA